MSKQIIHVLHATAEYQGLAKTGGLADMVAALTTAQTADGIDVRVCMPAYTGTRERLLQAQSIHRLNVRGYRLEVIEGRLHATGPLLWLIDCAVLFDRGDNPYRGPDGRDFSDNALRFGIFSQTVALLAQGSAGWQPDIAHLHDWHCALAAPWLYEIKSRPRIIFTIHNLAHQGLFEREAFAALGLPARWWRIEGVEFYHQLSFMKAGLQFSDLISTVSPTYAREIQTPEYGCNLDGVLRERRHLLHGIVNGIDDRQWNPANDTLIPERYDRSSVAHGKLRNKHALQRALGLPKQDLPLAIFIGRLVDQKGADLLLAARAEIRKLRLQFVLLGSGDPLLEQACIEWAREAPEQVRVLLKVDEPLAHQLTAASDLQIMPSRFEPCGLNQLYAQRYGTIPIVRKTGGLADTVVDATQATLHDKTATGVHFLHADSSGVLYGLQRGLELLANKYTREQLRDTAMARDFSWRCSAQQYFALYQQALAAAPSETH